MNFDQEEPGASSPGSFFWGLLQGIEQVAGQEFGAAGELSGGRRILGLRFIGLTQEGADAIGGICLVLGQGAAGELAESLARELGALLIGAAQLGLLLRSENLAEGGRRSNPARPRWGEPKMERYAAISVAISNGPGRSR